MKITREKIINCLAEKLKNDSSVFAFWLEGADAHNRVDKYSDIDIWIDIKDKHESKIFDKITDILSELGEIDYAHEINHPHPKIRQKFFHFKDTSEFLIIDICLQSHSRVIQFRKNFQGEKIKIIFDKSNVIQYKTINHQKFNNEIFAKVQELKRTFLFFSSMGK
jgi:predicted nucleotidyltransferase